MIEIAYSLTYVGLLGLTLWTTRKDIRTEFKKGVRNGLPSVIVPMWLLLGMTWLPVILGAILWLGLLEPLLQGFPL